MAKMNGSGKWKKRWALGLSISMAAVLSLGVFAACNNPDDGDDNEEEESAAMPADTQLLKNGNFEFYSEMTKDEDELRTILNTPTSWSFSSGSPSSDTKSGLVDLKYWESIAKSKYEYKSVADAYEKWDEGSIYDKLNFFYKCDNPSNNKDYDAFEDAYDALASGSDEKKFFNEQEFSSVDFEDVQYLWDELGENVALHGDKGEEKQEERGILMIHNRRTSDGAVGTAQSYSSSTTITLAAGTSAKISVWVKTAKLRHYYSDLKGENDTLDGLEVTSEAGAYIGVTQTVGGTTLDQMQIKNINTEVTNGGENATDNGWEQYTVYVRANTFATTTVKLVLGLGQGSSDDRYEAVNGYALFDDVECKIIENSEYVKATTGIGQSCNINSEKNDKLFDATKLYNADNAYVKTFAIDLYAGFNSLPLNLDPNDDFGLTTEKSGNTTYDSYKIDKSLGDNRGNDAKDSITAVMSLNDINGSSNGYLQSIAAKDFEKYPFANSDEEKAKDNIILLLSTNGAAYTAKMKNDTLFKVEKDKPLLVSFFVKTSEVITGRTGATITLVDGETKTTISAFDSTTIATVDIDDETKDIYDGWVRCFFFVSNDTDTAKTFSLEFSLGPTSIASSDKYDYGQGYAAFANFETKALTKTELSYASTGDRAKKVSLTGITEDSTVFDSVTATSDIEHGLGTPVNFKGVLAGSDWMNPNGTENSVPAGLLTGLLNHKHADNYGAIFNGFTTKTGNAAWADLFGDNNNRTALQPLVIMNNTADAIAYGYFASNATVSASSYQKISLRVKLSAGAKATVYLTDISEFSSTGYNDFLKPGAPQVTYWYDEEGNICDKDPSEKDSEIIFELQTNGLYRNAKDSSDTNYYANLKNYKEKDGNLVLGNGSTIAFYGHEGEYYAYRTEQSDGTPKYDQKVTDLYEVCKDYARYDYIKNKLPEAKIEVVNDGANASDWVTVTFYVHTGNEAKNYRLEVWAGDREGNNESKLPAGGYVFFDRYSSSSISNYETLLKEAVADLEDEDSETNKVLEDNGNLVSTLAQYYTFTFYDSANYLRYDVNEDTDEVGNLYASYDQSAYSEELIYLVYEDFNGTRTGTPSTIRFINYAASDVTVEPDTPAADDDGNDDKEDKEPISTGDILLIVSSALLGIVIIFVAVMLLVRHFAGKRRKAPKANAVPDKRYRPSAKKESAPKEDEEEENPFVKNRKAKEAAEAAEEEEAPAEEVNEEPEAPAEEPVEEAPAEAPAEESEPTGDEE